MQVTPWLRHVGEAEMEVLNIDLSLDIFIKISNVSRISSVQCFLLDSVSKHLARAIIFTFQIVGFLAKSQVIVGNFNYIGLDMSLVRHAELHHGVCQGLTDAGQEVFVVLRVEPLKVVTGLVVALPHVASQVPGVCHHQGRE